MTTLLGNDYEGLGGNYDLAGHVHMAERSERQMVHMAEQILSLQAY